jgi:hypothetical protein
MSHAPQHSGMHAAQGSCAPMPRAGLVVRSAGPLLATKPPAGHSAGTEAGGVGAGVAFIVLSALGYSILGKHVRATCACALAVTC